MVTGLTVKRVETKIFNTGKSLLPLPSSTSRLQNALQQLEKLLYRVLRSPSKSMKTAMQPAIKALVTKELMRHPEMNVNISVGRCISEILRIMAPDSVYNAEHMKDFFELAVITFEKLSSASGGYAKMNKVIKTLSKFGFSELMSEVELDDLIARLFKQFLSVADSNSHVLVLKMKKIMTMIVEQSEFIKPEVVDLLVASARKENKIASPVCWQLGQDVLKNCADKLEPHLPDKVAEEVNGCLRKCIPSETDTSNLRKDSTHKRKLDGSKNVVQTVRRCLRSQDVNEHEKKTLSIHDSPPIISESATEPESIEHGENLLGSRIKVRWPDGKIYCEGVVHSFDCGTKRHRLLHDDGDEQLLDLNKKQWEFVENVPLLSDSMKREVPKKVSSPQCGIICVQGYNMKQSLAPILEALLMKHGDIAASCTFKTTYVRASLLEVVCNIVQRIQTGDITTIISQMEEIENQVADAEAANINMSWLRTHLEDVQKKAKVMKKSISFMDSKAKTIMVKKVAQRDMKDRCAELLAAHERFEMAEKFVKVLDVVEKNLNDSILESKTEEDLWVGQPIL